MLQIYSAGKRGWNVTNTQCGKEGSVLLQRGVIPRGERVRYVCAEQVARAAFALGFEHPGVRGCDDRRAQGRGDGLEADDLGEAAADGGGGGGGGGEESLNVTWTAENFLHLEQK